MFIECGPHRAGGTLYLGRRGAIEIGRSSARHVVLPGPKVSRKHCRLVRMEVGWQLVDLDSANGVSVNGERITKHDLQAGDMVDVGEYRLRFLVARGLAAAPGAIDKT